MTAASFSELDQPSGRRSRRATGIVGKVLHGHFAEFVHDRHAFMLGAHARAAKRGDVIRLRIGFRPVYLFNSPETIESVMVTHNAELERRIPVEAGSRFIGNGIFLSQGEQWRHLRSLILPVFHQRRVDSYGPLFVDCAETAIAPWRDGDVRDLHREMTRVAFGAAGRIFCSTDILTHVDAISGSTQAGAEVFVELLNRSLLPALAPTPGNVRAWKGMRRIDDLLYRLIAERRTLPDPPDDALTILMQARDLSGQPLTDKAIRDDLFVLLFGGHETTALALGWFWHLLATHPDLQENVIAEIDDVLGGARPVASDRDRLPRTRQAILESMRVFPPFWGSWREAMADCEIGGVRLAPGDRVMVSQWLAHHDPRNFDDPHTICPARWADTGRAVPRTGGYFPFGLGPRSCIASGFAMTEMTLVIVSILQRFRFRPAPGAAIRMHPSFTLRPKHGVPLVIERR